MWIARNKSGSLWLFSNRPEADSKGIFQVESGDVYEMDEFAFPEINYENSPIEFVKKNELIGKACEWLRENTYSVFVKSCTLYDAVEEFADNFKQAMKGGEI